jgi:SAM-dependent methyltransferase
MISIARNKNRTFINKGKVNIVEGDFDTQSFEKESFDKVCTVNTIYFWPNPEITAQKIFSILRPGGLAVVAFEDIGQLKRKKLNQDIFRSYKSETVKDLLSESGFGTAINIKTNIKGKVKFHCVVAKKT